jgi:hypothetical protein
MEALANLIPRTLDQIKPNGLKPLSDEPPKAVVLHQNPQAKQKLAVMLMQSFQALKTYGKEPEQIEAIIGFFNIALADYPFEKIEKAFAFYIRNNSEMPTPGDIANIIERGGKPAFDKAVYLSICKKLQADPYAYGVLTADEREYKADYEKFMVTGKNS